MEIKVGDYVRTKDGKIFKWKKFCTIDVSDWMEHTRKILFVQDEIKSSPNIIDLIEVGDYVNGHLVLNVIDFNDNTRNLSLEKIYDSTIAEEEIKSIVTKEQFKSMEYRIGE